MKHLEHIKGWGWVYEDDLPPMTDKEYSAWYKQSEVIDGVRMGPNPDRIKKERRKVTAVLVVSCTSGKVEFIKR